MIRINQIKMPIEHTSAELETKISRILKISNDFSYQIIKKSIDSRKKPQLFYIYSVAVECKNENAVMKKAGSKDISVYHPTKYSIPSHCVTESMNRPVVIGAGPAGLFSALVLAEAGYRPILIERGKPVEAREKDVTKFWETGVLNPNSNVIFGEGGAGTFSDGKLNTSVKDPSGRIRFVLETFVRFGADQSILYDNKPHIGTDVLVTIMKNMRAHLISLGCDIRFESCMIGIKCDANAICSITVLDEQKKQEYELECKQLILAPGHGARDTFVMLQKLQIPMEPKAFAVGFRVEHPQEMINQFAYGTDIHRLPAAPYKVTSNFPGGRGVYSFCMCPGGYVVNASSEEGMLVVNGMSYSGRNSKNANSAIIVSLLPEDLDWSDPLSGMKFQMEIERKTYELGQGKIPQQLLVDFKNNHVSDSYGSYGSMTKSATVFANLRGILPSEMEESFLAGMEHFGKIIPGFDRDDAILSGTESRTSSPVRICRNQSFESDVKGLYPCGEGAGYAGGITSAAVDGIKVAEAVIAQSVQQ